MGWLDDEHLHEEEKDNVEQESDGRSVKMLVQAPKNYVYRRASSEVQLLELMNYEPIEEGVTYNFITAGDVDCLSFFKIIMNKVRVIEQLVISTWCIASEDVSQLERWVQEGRIKKLDMYLGEVNSAGAHFKIEAMYDRYPNLGRWRKFKNHAKIFAGHGGGIYFGIQSSANVNTNPRCEQASITTTKEIYEFYKDYFDSVR